MNVEKRKVGDTGYEIEYDIKLDGKNYIFAINDKENLPYLVGEYTCNELFERYDNCVATDDYLTAMGEWTKRLDSAIADCKNKTSEIPDLMVLNKDDVEPLTSDMDIEHQVIVIKSDVFLREYRYSQKQLYFCVGGFGAKPNSRGRAVMCNSVDTNEHRRFDRSDVLGIIKADRIPDWAKSKIAEIQSNYSEPVTAKSTAKPTIKK